MDVICKKTISGSQLAEEVYFTLQGESCEPFPGVENAFADGSVCDRCYQDMVAAYARIRDRLGVQDEDADVEIIINSLRTITDELCCRMFAYGAQLGNKNEAV